jgi:hypothetical protein
LLSSCGGDDEKKDNLISPNDVDRLTQALQIQGADRESGDAPSPTGPGAAVLTPTVTQTTSSNGSSTPVVFSFEGTSAPVGAYVQVEGASSYFDVPISNPSNATGGNITLPVGLPANLDEGAFTLAYCVYDASGNVSNVGSLDVDVLRLGTGALQISLSWNTATDQDLYVVDPSGIEISYDNPAPDGTDGTLDYDNTDGYGPENIFWEKNAPDGEYSVSVNDYTGAGQATTCFVTITAAGVTKTYNVTTQNGSTAQVVTFTKDGSSYTF